jgi:hypothetical protein
MNVGADIGSHLETKGEVSDSSCNDNISFENDIIHYTTDKPRTLDLMSIGVLMILPFYLFIPAFMVKRLLSAMRRIIFSLPR